MSPLPRPMQISTRVGVIQVMCALLLAVVGVFVSLQLNIRTDLAAMSPATPGAVACKFGPMTLPQSAKADWGFFFLRHRSPHPAECKADHKSSSHGIPQVRGCGTSLTPPDRSAWVIFRNLAHAGTADQKNREWIGTAHNGLAFI